MRHPFERLVSAYIDKVVPEEGYLAEAFREEFGEPTFSKFVGKVLKDAQHGSFDIHWEPFISACSYCYFNYSIISKLETVDEDREVILETVGARVPERKRIQNQKIGKKIENVTSDLFSELTTEACDALASIYRYDLEMFEYDSEKYLKNCNRG